MTYPFPRFLMAHRVSRVECFGSFAFGEMSGAKLCDLLVDHTALRLCLGEVEERLSLSSTSNLTGVCIQVLNMIKTRTSNFPPFCYSRCSLSEISKHVGPSALTREFLLQNLPTQWFYCVFVMRSRLPRESARKVSQGV